MIERRPTLRTFAAAYAIVAASVMLASCNNNTSVAPLSITSGHPPNGTVGTAYNFNLDATGGGGGYSWAWHAAQGSTLPAGLSISMCEVLTPPGQGCNQPQSITGVPTTAGTYKVVVVVSGGDSQISTTYTITVGP